MIGMQDAAVESLDFWPLEDATRRAVLQSRVQMEVELPCVKGGACFSPSSAAIPGLQLPSKPQRLQSLNVTCHNFNLNFTGPEIIQTFTQPSVMTATMAEIKANDHRAYMEFALSLARKSPPKPTNYRVGAVVVDQSTNEVLAHGYTLELEGNTHAEQCCLIKLTEAHGVPEERLTQVLPKNLALYTTVEPCSKRLSGNMPCAERILRLAEVIKTVYVGVMEPKKFVADNTGREALEKAGIQFVHVEGLEDEILKVAKAGHESQGE